MIIRSLIATVGLATLIGSCSSLSSTSTPVPTESFDADAPPGLIELHFENDGDRLNGHLYTANGVGPHPTVVLLHGYPGNERNLDIAQDLRRDGFNVLFFHYRGAWGSGGAFSLSNAIDDVEAALTMLRSRAEEYRVDSEKLILVGHSMGGFMALQGAANDGNIRCVAAISPASFGVFVDEFKDNTPLAQGLKSGADQLPMLNGWSGDAFARDMAENGETFDLSALAPQLSGKSVLLIAGDRDDVLPPDIFHAPLTSAYSDLSEIKLTTTVLSGDHSFSWSRGSLIQTIKDWSQGCR